MPVLVRPFAPLRALFAVAAFLALVGCGFHLKGPATLGAAFRDVYLAAPDRYSAVHGALVDALEQSGATLRGARGDAGGVLEVSRDETGRRIMSVSARNVPTEYEIYYNVTYRVLLDGKQVLAPTELQASRVIAYDETAQLEKEQEERIVRDALARDIAERIVRQLSAL